MFNKVWAFMDGKKAYVGGLAFIFTGLGMMLTSYQQGQGFSHDAWMKILEGWTIIAAKSAINKTSVVKALIVGLALCSLSAPAKAGVLGDLVGELHILDNMTPATFYDVTRSQFLGGGTTELFQKYYVGGVLGVAKPIMVNGTQDETRALFNTGLCVHAGTFLVDHVSYLKSLTSDNKVFSGLLKYGTAGYWGTYDWTNKEFRHGPYAGFEIKFGSGGDAAYNAG